MDPSTSRSALVVLAAAILLACGNETSGAGGAGGATVSTAGHSSSGGSSSGGSSATGGSGAGSTGNGGSSSADLYLEPAEIVGGPCAASPTAVSQPCSGSMEQGYCRLTDPSDVIMAICWAYGLDQCEAMDDCESGWHPCTATEYVARGGRDVAPDFSSATDRAWLAACARDLGDARLRNVPCAYCGDADFEPKVEWWCDGEVVYEGGMAGTTLGVAATPECMRVGANLPANGAFWGMDFTTAGPSFVLCCLDAL